MTATAVAHPMQALVKYHGLKDWQLRIPYHDSISVNMEALWTKTTVEFGSFDSDTALIDGAKASEHVFLRCMAVIERVRALAGIKDRARVSSMNSLGPDQAKGLGFSSSAGAALAAAAFKAARLDDRFGWDLTLISKIARRLAGSACRSVVGEYARWYAGTDDESSYARRIATRDGLDMAVVIVPLSSDIETEEAHKDAESSPFFEERVQSAKRRVEEMEWAIREGDLIRVGELAEADTLELHAIAMTGRTRMLFYRPESIAVMNLVRRMREEGLPAYFSMQTGPSVFVNTYPEYAEEARGKIELLGLRTIVSRVGREAIITDA